MQLIELDKWSVRSDPEITREAYALLDSGGAESCGCEACFNFAATRHLVYSADVIELFESLGIDPLLEAQVSHDGGRGEETHAYTAYFFLVGEIASGPATTVVKSGDSHRVSLVPAGEDNLVGFSADTQDAPESFRGLPTVRLEVSVVAPWVSNAPEPSDS
jgi:hypothetical protein